MQEQTLENEDARIGLKFPVKKTTTNGYEYLRIQFKFDEKYDCSELIVLTPSEHETLMQQIKNAANPIDKQQHQQMQEQINDLQNKNSKLASDIQKQKQTITDLKTRNDNIAKEKDALETQLDNSIDASELEDLQNEVTELKDKLETSESNYNKLLVNYNTINEENISYLEEIRELKETNKFLNEQVGALTSTFKKTNDELESKYKSEQKELKETIKNNQTHIDELTDKYQSLLPSKEYIPQKQHYDEVGALKDKIRQLEKDINTKDAEIEKQLTTQKSDLEIAHQKKINDLQNENTETKAQLLVGYNQELDKLKLKYNNLANEYNYLLNSVDSLTRFNTLFNGKHNEIKKDKEQVEILEIKAQLPSDKETIEFIPKEQS